MDRKRTGRRIPQIVQAARGMRLEPTPAERVLGEQVRHRRLCGIQIRRQHPVDRFVLDFHCASRKLDGDVHDTQREHDDERTAMLSMRGIRVIRFRNQRVLHHLEPVLQTLRAEICPPHTAAGA